MQARRETDTRRASGHDVLVQVEEIVWIVATLELDEAIVIRSVSRADAVGVVRV